ncbi:MAG: Imm5 family immunity protein [Polyangiaceae bacterium]
MTLPTEVSNAVTAARATLSNPDGALPLPLRIAIWRAMGDVGVTLPSGELTPGHRRRAELAIRVVRHGLGEWEAFWTTREPHDLLAVAEAYLGGYATPREVWTAQNRLTLSRDPMETDDLVRTSLIAEAARDAAVVAGYDMFLDELSLEDDDLDPDAWDASFFVSCVFAAGPPWLAESDPAARRAFWTWYLDVAVPAAYPD